MALHSWPLQKAIYTKLSGNIKTASTHSGTVTYAVTVASGTNSYGSGNKYFISSYSGASPTLSLMRGRTYRFTQSDNTNSNHPFKFSTTPNGTHGGGSEYTTNATTSGSAGSAGAYTEITITDSTPTLYYYCQYHSGMGGTASIVDDTSQKVIPIYDDVPDGTSAPYINIGEETAINDGTKTVDAVEHTLTIHVWSEYRGRYEIKHIMQEVYQNLHNAAITVSGASLVNIRQEFATTLEEADGITRHGVMRFRAIVFDN